MKKRNSIIQFSETTIAEAPEYYNYALAIHKVKEQLKEETKKVKLIHGIHQISLELALTFKRNSDKERTFLSEFFSEFSIIK
ncbi:hypothetical protein FZC66_08770 [Priestia megaterium]|nr:hypothetical protein FZC66_08770 [Priestia megaterium]